jgi:hypothetical protein
MYSLQGVFGDGIISMELQRPCFQAMNLCNQLLLCGILFFNMPHSKVYRNNTHNENDLKESILNVVFPFHQQDINVQSTMHLLDLTCLCELKKTIFGTFFKYGESKPSIISKALK